VLRWALWSIRQRRTCQLGHFLLQISLPHMNSYHSCCCKDQSGIKIAARTDRYPGMSWRKHNQANILTQQQMGLPYRFELRLLPKVGGSTGELRMLSWKEGGRTSASLKRGWSRCISKRRTIRGRGWHRNSCTRICNSPCPSYRSRAYRIAWHFLWWGYTKRW